LVKGVFTWWEMLVTNSSLPILANWEQQKRIG
jgi:hypothetical protein